MMTFKRGLMIGALIGSVTLYAGAAQAHWLEFLFPHLKKEEPNLYETLQAPFADVPAGEEANSKVDREFHLPENAVSPEKPHRQVNHISTYVSELVSKALLYEGEDYRADMVEILKDFDAPGRSEYRAFLQENNIMKVLESQRYFVRSFVSDVPILLNTGAVDGRYRWLFEVPVMVSYMERGKNNYRNGATPTNQKILVRLQVGRHPEFKNNTGVLVESWTGTVRKMDKK